MPRTATTFRGTAAEFNATRRSTRSERRIISNPYAIDLVRASTRSQRRQEREESLSLSRRTRRQQQQQQQEPPGLTAEELEEQRMLTRLQRGETLSQQQQQLQQQQNNDNGVDQQGPNLVENRLYSESFMNVNQDSLDTSNNNDINSITMPDIGFVDLINSGESSSSDDSFGVYNNNNNLDFQDFGFGTLTNNTESSSASQGLTREDPIDLLDDSVDEQIVSLPPPPPSMLEDRRQRRQRERQEQQGAATSTTETIAPIIAVDETLESLQHCNNQEEPAATVSPKSSSLDDNDNNDENSTMVNVGECVICISAKVTHVVVPCGHMCVCNDCKGIRKCPLCRRKASKIMKVYFCQ